MKKAKALRAILETAFPHFQKNPDKLQLFVTNRKIEPLGETQNYRVKYQLSVYIESFTGDISSIELILLKWAREYSPDLLANKSAIENFANINIEILDYETCHAEIELNLTETVLVTTGENGQLNGNYQAEPKWNDPFENDDLVKNDHENPPNFTNLDVKINGQ